MNQVIAALKVSIFGLLLVGERNERTGSGNNENETEETEKKKKKVQTDQANVQ
jgi:hypothetical protein